MHTEKFGVSVLCKDWPAATGVVSVVLIRAEQEEDGRGEGHKNGINTRGG